MFLRNVAGSGEEDGQRGGSQMAARTAWGPVLMGRRPRLPRVDVTLAGRSGGALGRKGGERKEEGGCRSEAEPRKHCAGAGPCPESSAEAGVRSLAWEREGNRDRGLGGSSSGRRASGRSEQALGRRI